MAALLDRGGTTADALIQAGAQVNARNNEGMIILYLASVSGRVDFLALLLEMGAQVDLPTRDEHPSALMGHSACVRLLLQAGASPLPAPSGCWLLAQGLRESRWSREKKRERLERD